MASRPVLGMRKAPMTDAHHTSDQQSLLEQWANLVATRVVNELEARVGLGDGDALAICEAVIGGVMDASLPENGGDLLKRAIT